MLFHWIQEQPGVSFKILVTTPGQHKMITSFTYNRWLALYIFKTSNCTFSYCKHNAYITLLFLPTKNSLLYFLTDACWCHFTSGGLARVSPHMRKIKMEADGFTGVSANLSIFVPPILPARGHINFASEVHRFSNIHQVKTRILAQCCIWYVF